MNVLVVEDSDLKYNNISAWLKQSGDVEVTRRYSRNGGLATIIDSWKSKHPFDLVVLDMQIPVFDGNMNEMDDRGGAFIAYMMDAKEIDIPYVICSSVAKAEDFPDALKVIKYDYLTSYQEVFQQIVESLTKK